MHEGSRRAVIAALLANASIAVAKFVGAAVTGSSAMLAEGIHSVADTTNQGMLLYGGSRAKRAPTPQHPFGYGRERYFWAFMVALVLFSLGGLFAAYEGLQKLQHPHEVESPEWAIGILLVAIVIESLAVRVAIREANRIRGASGWVRFIRRSKNPEIPVILLEDLGAISGLVLAISGISLTVITGEPRFDAMATFLIGLLLITIAVFLALELKSLLIGEAAGADDQVAIKNAIEGSVDVLRLIHMRTQHLGPDELLVAAKVEFAHDLSTKQLADAINAAEVRLREAVPTARVVYLEPDLLLA
ncbi:MAG: cation diffusion facilitator family transporter [Thermoleophilia bacterium]|nr:cation diffusion facilitator family transporter [Thermoleophilia bacterium]MDH3725268.1 cation diffusion facilitator family transporter [Thermoleophilia bacterium]